MRAFITGASGWIGSAVVPELIGNGHEVIGLARSDESAAALADLGAEAVRGTLDDLDTLRTAADGSDGVIHLAFKHDLAFTGNFQGAADADRAAVEAFGDVLAGSDRPLVIASGLLGLLAGQVATERDGHVADPTIVDPASGPATRHATAELALSFASRGVRSSIVRLSPTVHGDGDDGFVPRLIDIARATGIAGYVGDGANRWPAVHRDDAATLFRLAFEHAPAGSTLHGAADEGVPIREMADVFAAHLGIPTGSVAPEDAPAHFTWLAHFVALDSPASNALTRELLGWEPTGPSLIADLDQGHYFRT